MRKIAAALLALTVFLAGCAGAQKEAPKPAAEPQPAAEAPANDGKLVISTFGIGADKFKEIVVKPFEQQYGVEVVVEVGTNTDRLNKLKAQKENPVIDVMLISDYYAEIAMKEGLFEQINPANIPNLADVYDFAKNPDGYGPAYTQSRLGIAYNPEKIPGGITSWKDLWNPAYEGYIAIPDMSASAGPLVLAAVAKTYGQGEKDIDAGFKALIDLKPSVIKYFTKTSEMLSLMDRGEVWAAPTLDLFVVNQQKSGKVKWVVPAEGSYRLTNVVQVVKGTKRKDLAEKFINFLISKETQEASAAALSDAPVNQKAELPADLGQYLSYRENATKGIATMDQSFLVANQEKWVDRFMREVSQ